MSLADEGFSGTLFLATRNVQVPPDSIDDDPTDARGVITLNEAVDVIKRPRLFYGHADKIRKRALSMKIGTGLTPEDYEHVLWVDSLPDAFDVCLWMYECESYSWPEDPNVLPTISGDPALYLWRRDALRALAGRTPDVVPSWAATRYPTKDRVDGTAGAVTTLGNATDLGRTLWKPHTTPATVSGLPNVAVWYVAVYRMYVDKLASSMGAKFTNDRVLVLREH